MNAVPAREAPDRIRISGEHGLADRSGALFFPALSLLVVSDLHLEKGSSFARRRVFLPPYDTAATLARLKAAIDFHQPEVVVSLGDSFHDGEGAGRMPAPFRDSLLAMMEGRDWYWVAGNHDPHAPAGLPGATVQHLSVGGLTFRHEPSREAILGEIAGHLHPGARIVQRGRSVRRACFASDGRRLVMPAFGAYTGTLNVLDRAYRHLFAWNDFTAYMLGQSRIFPITGSMLVPG